MIAKDIINYLRAVCGIKWEWLAEELGIPGGRGNLYARVNCNKDLKLDLFITMCNKMGYELVVRPADRRQGVFEVEVTNETTERDPSPEQFDLMLKQAMMEGRARAKMNAGVATRSFMMFGGAPAGISFPESEKEVTLPHHPRGETYDDTEEEEDALTPVHRPKGW